MASDSSSVPARVRALAKRLAQPRPMRRGSLSERYVKCNKTGCACSQDPQARHGPYYSLTRKVGGQTRSQWVAADQAERIREQLAAGQAFRHQVEVLWAACEQWAQEEVAASPGGVILALDRDPFRPVPVPTTSLGMLIVAAWHDAYGAPLGILTPAGRAAAERLGSFCPPSAARTPPALRQDPRRVPAWRALFRRNAAGQAPVRAPVLIVQGGAEGAAPLQVVARIDGRLCGLGGRSALRLYPGVHHGQVVDASGQDVLAWLDARLAGRPAAPCGPATTAPPAPPPSGVTAHLAG